LDVAFIPRALALGSEFVWVMEYDVDFSGCWADFFHQFVDDRANLLTTYLVNRARFPDWSHWPFVHAPNGVGEERMCRSFNPILRMSRGLAPSLRAGVRRCGLARSLRIHAAEDRPPRRFPGRGHRRRGTAVPRTAQRPQYQPRHIRLASVPERVFHEAPDQFTFKNMLYHPVKPDVPEWETGSLPL
jgi:hypothetical protein